MPDINQVTNFFLVFLRAVAFVTAGPLLAFRGIPSIFRVGLPFFLAIVLYPLVGDLPERTGGAWEYGLAAVSEVGVGLLLGFTVTLIVNSIRVAGQFIDLQIGYAMSAMADPLSGMQSTLIAQFFYYLAFVLFLVMDGHHLLILALAKSYEMVPLGMAHISNGVGYQLIQTFSGAITISLRVAAPVLSVLLISDLTLGFLSRTTPQINVFLTGFLIKIMVGMLVLAFMIPFMGTVMQSVISVLENDLYTLLRALM